MGPIRILVDSFADEGLLNAQMGNAREIIYRLDPERFHITTFVMGKPDSRIAARRNTRLIQLPRRRQTVRILSEFLFGAHHLLFYPKASPATRLYLGLRSSWRDSRVVVGTIESQCNLKDVTELSPAARRLWEQTILRSDVLYSNCAFVKQSLRTEYGRNSEIIATGADTEFFTPDWDRARKPRPQVLFVGSLRDRKHPERVVEAAERFPQADFRIVGDGYLREALQARVDRNRLANVVFPGALNAERLREEYRDADIFFFPSSFEGSPKVIVEAAACGLPVICRNAYSPETVLHGITGYQTPSSEELFSYLGELLANPEVRLKMGRAARLHSLQFDWDLIVKKWEQAFIAIAERETARWAA